MSEPPGRGSQVMVLYIIHDAVSHQLQEPQTHRCFSAAEDAEWPKSLMSGLIWPHDPVPSADSTRWNKIFCEMLSGRTFILAVLSNSLLFWKWLLTLYMKLDTHNSQQHRTLLKLFGLPPGPTSTSSSLSGGRQCAPGTNAGQILSFRHFLWCS